MRFGYYDGGRHKGVDPPWHWGSFSLHGRPMIRLDAGPDRTLIFGRSMCVNTGRVRGAALRSEIHDWLRENVAGKYRVLVSERWAFLFIVFTDKSDQFHFKMRWNLPK